jgi:hypothetical protein
MNIVLPVDYQSFSPLADGLGTADARSENNNRTAIEPVQNPSQTKQSAQDSASNGNKNSKQSKNSVDKVNISPEGKKAVEDESINSLSEEEKAEVKTLEDRDREVRVHEQAHAAVGGQYAGAPSYEYETGPDAKRYAVSGEVSIDVSEEENPEDTVEKMQIVRAAALAPSEPSSQDLKVAAEATQKESAARAQVSQEQVSSEPTNEEPNQVKPKSKAQAYEEIGAQTNKSQFSISA